MRAQASIEYTLAAVLVLLIVIPTSYFLYSHSQKAGEELSIAQINKIGNDIVKAAEQVYFMGAPAKIVLEEKMPDNVVGMNIIFDEATGLYELIMKVRTKSGISELSFPSDAPLNSAFEEELYSEGIKKIRVEAKEGLETGQLFSWISTAIPCIDDDDCYDNQVCSTDLFECVGCTLPVCDACHSPQPHCGACVIDDSGSCTVEGEICCNGLCINPDVDGDTYLSPACTGGDDCNDNNAAVNPGALEICDGVDNNCISGIDEGCDDDSDNYCDAAIICSGTPLCANGCSQLDCDDSNEYINPGYNVYCDCNPETGGGLTQGRPEECGNEIDDDCNGLIDEGCYCSDGTLTGTCSATKPEYCDAELQLVDACYGKDGVVGTADDCGCPSEGICQGTGIYAGKCLRTQVFSPHADAYVDERYPDSMFGYANYMYAGGNIGGSYKKARAYLRFCSLPTNVVEATLNIYSYPIGTFSAYDFSIVNIGCVWYETTTQVFGYGVVPGITWNNQPMNYGCAGLTKPISYSLFMSSGWKNIDITEIVQQPYIGQDSFTQNCANMVLLGDSNAVIVSISSRQAAASYRPYLEIKYLVP